MMGHDRWSRAAFTPPPSPILLLTMTSRTRVRAALVAVLLLCVPVLSLVCLNWLSEDRPAKVVPVSSGNGAEAAGGERPEVEAMPRGAKHDALAAHKQPAKGAAAALLAE